MATTLRTLADRGHEVLVLVDRLGITGQQGAMRVVARPTLRDTLHGYQWCDVVFTQLGGRDRAIQFAALTGKPVTHFLRGTDWSRAPRWGIPDLAVFSTSWLRDRVPWSGETAVLHPPVVASQYNTLPGDAVTLVNLSTQKGAPVFFELARRLPLTPFIGVKGAYGEQAIPDEVPPNVSILATTDDMRSVYSQTRVLLMPSQQEAYGRVGLEAACSGIPTIAAPLPGIREALGDGALYADPENVDAWYEHLVRLGDEGYYQELSKRALSWAAPVATDREIIELEERVLTLVSTPLVGAIVDHRHEPTDRQPAP